MYCFEWAYGGATFIDILLSSGPSDKQMCKTNIDGKCLRVDSNQIQIFFRLHSYYGVSASVISRYPIDASLLIFTVKVKQLSNFNSNSCYIAITRAFTPVVQYIALNHLHKRSLTANCHSTPSPPSWILSPCYIFTSSSLVTHFLWHVDNSPLLVNCSSGESNLILSNCFEINLAGSLRLKPPGNPYHAQHGVICQGIHYTGWLHYSAIPSQHSS